MNVTEVVNYTKLVKDHLEDSSDVTSIRLLAREVPDLLLFKVTFKSQRFQILCYDEVNAEMECIFEEYGNKFNVINGTINAEKTLFFFVTAAQDRKRASTTRYRTYLCHIRPTKNVCKLGSRTHYTQFQIISPHEDTTGTEKPLYLLVMVHPCCIELNIIPREHRDSHLVISGQGEFIPVVNNFLWANWEPSNNVLFTISSRGEGDLADISTCFTVRQFVLDPESAVGHFVILAEFELTSIPFPKNFYFDRASDLRYSHGQYAISKRLSDTSVNTVGLWHSNGSLCLCVQRPSWISRVQYPSYKIYVLHYKKAMFCSLEPRHNDDSLDQPPIVFMMLNGGTIAAINPFFIHVVQISRTSRSCLSMILPKLANIKLESTVGWTSAFNSFHSKAVLFDLNTNILMSLEIGLEMLLSSLELASSTLTRALIFHYVIVNYQDMTVHKRLLNCILKDLCEPEIQLFLHEYLVASIFRQFMRRSNAGHSRFIQHTTLNEDIIQTHAFGRNEHPFIVKITVGNLDSFLAMHKVTRYSRDAFIQNLYQQVGRQRTNSIIQMQNKFIPSFTHTLPDTAASQVSQADYHQSENTSFFEKLRESLSLRRSVRSTKPLSNSLSLAPPSVLTEEVLGRLPFFLNNPLYTNEELRPLRNAFANFLQVNILDANLESYNDTLVNDYIHCVMFQVRQLLHIIWCLTINADKAAISLNSDVEVNKDDWDCFQVLETVIICFKSNGYPVPLQVEDVYARLAFRLLDLRTLIQYLECDVLRITENFACEIIELESGMGNQYTPTELLNLKKEILPRFPMHVQIDKLLPRCKELFDFYYRTDSEYRSLLQSKIPPPVCISDEDSPLYQSL